MPCPAATKLSSVPLNARFRTVGCKAAIEPTATSTSIAAEPASCGDPGRIVLTQPGSEVPFGIDATRCIRLGRAWEVYMMNALRVLWLALVLFAATSSLAYADCYKDGKAYPTGTVIEGFICTPDGHWVKA